MPKASTAFVFIVFFIIVLCNALPVKQNVAAESHKCPHTRLPPLINVVKHKVHFAKNFRVTTASTPVQIRVPRDSYLRVLAVAPKSESVKLALFDTQSTEAVKPIKVSRGNEGIIFGSLSHTKVYSLVFQFSDVSLRTNSCPSVYVRLSIIPKVKKPPTKVLSESEEEYGELADISAFGCRLNSDCGSIGKCNKRTGRCVCPRNFSGPLCNRCAAGYSGADCTLYSPSKAAEAAAAEAGTQSQTALGNTQNDGQQKTTMGDMILALMRWIIAAFVAIVIIVVIVIYIRNRIEGRTVTAANRNRNRSRNRILTERSNETSNVGAGGGGGGIGITYNFPEMPDETLGILEDEEEEAEATAAAAAAAAATANSSQSGKQVVVTFGANNMLHADDEDDDDDFNLDEDTDEISLSKTPLAAKKPKTAAVTPEMNSSGNRSTSSSDSVAVAIDPFENSKRNKKVLRAGGGGGGGHFFDQSDNDML